MEDIKDNNLESLGSKFFVPFRKIPINLHNSYGLTPTGIKLMEDNNIDYGYIYVTRHDVRINLGIMLASSEDLMIFNLKFL